MQVPFHVLILLFALLHFVVPSPPTSAWTLNSRPIVVMSGPPLKKSRLQSHSEPKVMRRPKPRLPEFCGRCTPFYRALWPVQRRGYMYIYLEISPHPLGWLPSPAFPFQRRALWIWFAHACVARTRVEISKSCRRHWPKQRLFVGIMLRRI